MLNSVNDGLFDYEINHFQNKFTKIMEAKEKPIWTWVEIPKYKLARC